MNFPEDLKYTKTHEWVRVEGDIATVGITEHAQSELGDIVFIDLPEVGRVLQVSESFTTVESVKTVSDVYAPVAGEVVEANSMLDSQAELVNSDSYGEGWMLKIKMSDPSAADELLSNEAYAASLDD